MSCAASIVCGLVSACSERYASRLSPVLVSVCSAARLAAWISRKHIHTRLVIASPTHQRIVAGGGDDDWGAFEGDGDAATAAAPAPAHEHANGFVTDAAAAPSGSAGGWSSFGAGPAPFPPANGWGGGAAPAVSAVLSTDEAGHRRGVSAGGALPEDLFSEPSEAAPAVTADGPLAEAEDDDFGDFADAEVAPPVPAQQPAEQPGVGSLSKDWQATALQTGHPLAGSASVQMQQPPTSGQPAPPAVELSGLPAVQSSSSAGNSTAVPTWASPARTAQPSQPAPAANSADDGFADFGAFAEAEPAAGDSSTAVPPSDALWHSSPPVVSSPAPGSAAVSGTASAEGQSGAASQLIGSLPSATAEPAAAAAGGSFSNLAPQAVSAEAAQHRRGVSRCDVSMPVQTAF